MSFMQFSNIDSFINTMVAHALTESETCHGESRAVTTYTQLRLQLVRCQGQLVPYGTP